MRDPARIPRILKQLRDYWVLNPDLRLCQIVGNFLEDESIPDGEPALHLREPQMTSRGYNTEDDAFERWLEELSPDRPQDAVENWFKAKTTEAAVPLSKMPREVLEELLLDMYKLSDKKKIRVEHEKLRALVDELIVLRSSAVMNAAAAKIAAHPMETYEDAVEVLQMLVDPDHSEDKIGTAVLFVTSDRDRFKQKMQEAQGAAEMETCVICNFSFGVGGDIASSVYEKDGEWFVTGGYGSRLFDLTRLKFTGKELADTSGRVYMKRPAKPCSPICDVCVQVWLNCGIVVMDKEDLIPGEA